jgi:hypothetical protein
LTTLKMAVFAPMPSASVSTATAVKPGFFNSWRKANLRSFMVDPSTLAAAMPHAETQVNRYEIKD